MSEDIKLRIEVAYDAWKLTLLATPNLTIGRNHYLYTLGSTRSFLQSAKSGTPLEELTEGCKVCALGALFLAKTMKHGGDAISSVGRSAMRTLPFYAEDLNTIETLFENCYVRGVGTEQQASELLDKFEHIRGKWDSKELARALFLNLIENEGRLKLNAKLPTAGLDPAPTLSETALRVLEQHNIPLALVSAVCRPKSTFTYLK
jgi:hypothetical protein